MFSPGNVPCFCQRMSLKRLVLAIASILLMTTIITYFWLPTPDFINGQNQKYETDDPTIRKMLGLLDVDDESISGNELKKRIEELLRIKGSVQKELRSLEEKRTEMQRQTTSLVNKIDELKKEATKHNTELEKLRMSLEQAHVAQIELAERNTPELRPPLRLTAGPKDNFIVTSKFLSITYLKRLRVLIPSIFL